MRSVADYQRAFITCKVVVGECEHDIVHICDDPVTALLKTLSDTNSVADLENMVEIV